MEIKLTNAGLKLFGFSPDRIIISVTTDRAYHLMMKGYANKDKPFMFLYEINYPKPELKKPIVWIPNPDFGPPVKVGAVKKPELKQKPKKEKAISRRAAAREKAVKK